MDVWRRDPFQNAKIREGRCCGIYYAVIMAPADTIRAVEVARNKGKRWN